MEDLRHTTLQEHKNLLSQGMQQLTPEELEDQLLKLGYAIPGHSMTFNYVNRGNDNSYNAKAVHIHDIKTGHSFSHIDVFNPNKNQLQELRRWNFVFHLGLIWEL